MRSTLPHILGCPSVACYVYFSLSSLNKERNERKLLLKYDFENRCRDLRDLRRKTNSLLQLECLAINYFTLSDPNCSCVRVLFMYLIISSSSASKMTYSKCTNVCIHIKINWFIHAWFFMSLMAVVSLALVCPLCYRR